MYNSFKNFLLWSESESELLSAGTMMDPNEEGKGPVSVNMLQTIYLLQLKAAGGLNTKSNVKNLVRFITEHGDLHNVPERLKMNKKADRMRAVGNRLYLERHFEKALISYNESISFAEPGTDRLGMGYANRSAVCFELGEYEMALFNIDMAKKHDYPEKLMAKLLERERNSKQKIADGYAKQTIPCPRIKLNVDVNPKIPFMAKGIALNYDPKFGRGLVAEKDFNPGDVISDEKPELCGIDYNLSFQTCNQCSARLLLILIPCPRCPFFMYCSEECRELNWKLYHRFECDIASKLCSVSRNSDMITPRFFFYGLSSFGDNLHAMMKYCEKPIITESNPLELDYTNPNRLEVFKTLHNTKPRNSLELQVIANDTAAAYYVAFMKNPVVNSIIRTERQRQFFLRSMVAYSLVASSLSTVTVPARGVIATIRPTGNMMNHSCDPHTATICHAGRVMEVLVRPVRKGEQIFASYGPLWYKQHRDPLPFKCLCIVCDHQDAASREWHRLKKRNLPPNARKDVELLYTILHDEGIARIAKQMAMQQFIKRYSRYHPEEQQLIILMGVYRNCLYIKGSDENMALVRAKLWAAFVEQ